MRYPPDLSDQTITGLLESRYGLALRELVFLPLGEDGWAYRAVEQAGDGRAWFVQLRQQPIQDVLTITAYLREQAGLDWIPPALPALDGSLSVEAAGLCLSVCPFIDGVELMDRPPATEQAQQVGRMLARLHKVCLPETLRSIMPVETYARHQDTARRVLSTAMERYPTQAVQSSLAGVVQAHSDEIEQVLSRARRLGEAIRRKTPAHVLCHADIHEANILEDSAGRLWVIDWDGLMLAPAERDLAFWRDSAQWESFHAGYGSQVPVDEDIIRYYSLEWVVQEIADYGENIFFLPLSDEQKAHSLAECSRLFEAGNLVEQALRGPASASALEGL